MRAKPEFNWRGHKLLWGNAVGKRQEDLHNY